MYESIMTAMQEDNFNKSKIANWVVERIGSTPCGPFMLRGVFGQPVDLNCQLRTGTDTEFDWLKQSIAMDLTSVDALRMLPSAQNVRMKKFKQAWVNGWSNYPKPRKRKVKLSPAPLLGDSSDRSPLRHTLSSQTSGGVGDVSDVECY